MRPSLSHLVRARYSPHKIVGIIGGVGSGKSGCGAEKAVDTILDYPGSHGLCAGLTYSGHALTLMKPYIEEELGGIVDMRFKSVTGQLEVRLPGLPVTTIDFAGMQNAGDYKRIMYQSYDWIWADELTHFHKENWRWLKLRIRGKVGPRRIWFTTVPDGPDHWLLQEIAQLGLIPNESLFHCSSYDNKTLPPDYLEMLESTNTGGAYKRLVLGQWSALEGEMFTRLPDQVDMPDTNKMRISIGVDPAYTSRTGGDFFAIAVFGMDLYKNIYFLDAFMKKGLEFGQAINTMQEYANKWGAHEVIIESSADGYLYKEANHYVRNLVPISPKTDKVTRALPLIHAWNKGEVKCAISVGQVRSQVIAQIMQFPAGLHDDMVDACAYAFNAITGQLGVVKYRPTSNEIRRLA